MQLEALVHELTAYTGPLPTVVTMSPVEKPEFTGVNSAMALKHELPEYS